MISGMQFSSGTTANNVSPNLPFAEAMELSARSVDAMMQNDMQFPSLAEKLRIGSYPTVSGLQETDYPSIVGAKYKPNLCTVKKVALPVELIEHFGHMQCNCMMGIFSEVKRAWLTIDSDIYVWKLEDGCDLAYFDGLSDAILCVALLTPAPGIFQPHIKYLLALATVVEVVLLGVSFSNSDENLQDGESSEMHLLPEPLFSLATDSSHIISMAGTSLGRIFMGGKEGSLYEFVYKADDGWFGKRSRKINHSTSSFSFLIPSFISSAFCDDTAAIVQIVVDDTRNILYTRSEKGTIQLFDLGTNGLQTTRISTLNHSYIALQAAKIASDIDRKIFSHIVGISSISWGESGGPLCLVAVTVSGVRYYFSGYDVTSVKMCHTLRPTCLKLQHVRIPPGFSMHSIHDKLLNCHLSHHYNGTILMSNNLTDASELLWIISNDGFPLQIMALCESHSTVTVDGYTWCMSELPSSSTKRADLFRASFGQLDPPLVSIQHTEAPRKYALISSQGVTIITKLRPVDILRQMLIENGGYENEAIKTFFASVSETQAAAMCLILACSQSLSDAQVAEWATRAFLCYGGEPRLIYSDPQNRPVAQVSTPMNSQVASPSVSTFRPYLVSTPSSSSSASPVNMTHTAVRPSPETPPSFYSGSPTTEIQFSGKHGGLYLFFARIVRPIWLAALSATSFGGNLVDSEDVDWINNQLYELKTFLERNAQFGGSSGYNPSLASLTSQSVRDFGRDHIRNQQDALLRERQSILHLQQIINHTIQVLGLWKVVCEHQSEKILNSLSQEIKNQLRGMRFRELIISPTGRKVCNALVSAIIQCYLTDNANTDMISGRLHAVCPSLYDADDAISAKAYEKLIKARSMMQADESSSSAVRALAQEAVNMCQDISGKLDLQLIVDQLLNLHAYSNVVELCLSAASKRDPQGLALHYFRADEPAEDIQGRQALNIRISCYYHVLEMLRKLFQTTSTGVNCASPRLPGPPSLPDPNAMSADEVLQTALRSTDMMFHVSLYRWMIENNYKDRLLSIQSSFLEQFLVRSAKHRPESLFIFELLWKFYEKQKNYNSAAKILMKLADRHSAEITLQMRLEYLSRAIMCVKSGEFSPDSSSVSGEILHVLEDKIEVARIQMQIIQALEKQQGNSTDIQTAINKLNSDLLNISQLYGDYAEPFELWECQLAIFHCSGYQEEMLIETIWEKIISIEICTSCSNNQSAAYRIEVVGNKIKSLGKIYAGYHKYFPLEFIMKKLELFSCSLFTPLSSSSFDFSWVFLSLLEVGISLPRLLEVYNKFCLSNDPVWLCLGAPNHLFHVLLKLLETFADNPTILISSERRTFTVLCQDSVANYLGVLYTKEDNQELVRLFRSIQTRLEKIIWK